jgi:uncharacterized repeat protein (TIGR04138 family)
MTEDIPPLVKLLAEDRRFKFEAYKFVRDGLGYAQEELGLGDEEEVVQEEGTIRKLRHVCGQDLCHALRLYAAEQYGYMARLVLSNWGIRATGDFGEIVYNLIRIGEMTKSDDDRREDFDDVYDFDQALMREFVIDKVE